MPSFYPSFRTKLQKSSTKVQTLGGVVARTNILKGFHSKGLFRSLTMFVTTIWSSHAQVLGDDDRRARVHGVRVQTQRALVLR